MLDTGQRGDLRSLVTLDFRILGPLEVSDETGHVPLGGPKQRGILAILVLDAGRVVATDRLIDLLWGEEAPKTATASLQNAVGRLRRALGADVLETRAPGYVLRVAQEQIDAGRFERSLADARRLPAEERRELPGRSAFPVAWACTGGVRLRRLRAGGDPSARGASARRSSRRRSAPTSSSVVTAT